MSERLIPADEWVLAADTGPNMAGRLKEMWRYRRILGFFAARSIQVLYAKTRLGWTWLLIRPLAPLIASVIVYGGIMSIPSGGVPYFLFFVSGAVIWGWFEGTVGWGARGLELNRNLVAKLYIPRMILPLATMSAGTVEPLVNTGVLIGAVLYYYFNEGVWYVRLEPKLLIVIPAILIVVTFSFALSLALSLWQVRARDVRFGMGYVTGFWFFLTPVAYPITQIPEKYRWIAYVNPLTGPVEAFKWGTLGIGEFHGASLAYSAGVAIVSLVAAAWYFARMESVTADKV